MRLSLKLSRIKIITFVEFKTKSKSCGGKRFCGTGVASNIWERGIVSSWKNVLGHTSSNFISKVVTRASSKFSKNHILMMCRMQKWTIFFCSSLDIRDNLKVAFFGKNLTNIISKENCATFISGNQYDRLSQQSFSWSSCFT